MEDGKILADNEMEQVTGGGIIQQPRYTFICPKCQEKMMAPKAPFCGKCQVQMKQFLDW